MLRNNTSRSKTAITFLYLTIAITAIFSIYEVFLVYNVQETGLDEDALIESMPIMLLGSFTAVILLGVMLGTIITFIRWFRRAYFNLHQLVDTLSYTEGWAAGAWFVPFLNLVRPYKIMAELYDEATSLLGEEEAEERSQVGWWWAFYLISNTVDNIETRVGASFEISTVAGIKVVSVLITAAAALLAIHMIKGYEKLELRLYDLDVEDEIYEIGTELN